MSTKDELLYDQIFKKYITGQINSPEIPVSKSVTKIVNMLNTDDTAPLFDISKFTELSFSNLDMAFRSIIDDLDLLYASTERQSQKILDQLTNSSIEYLGVTFELNKIKNEADDINNGKTGLDNIRYVHTESFSNINNINTDISTIDVNTNYPVVNVQAGQMYIPINQSNVLDFYHYYGRKLNILPSNYNGNIVSSRYIGNLDPATIFDPLNDEPFIYEVKTSDPTKMKLSFILQLRQDGKEEEINEIGIKLHNDMTKGSVRVEYKTNIGWQAIKDVPTQLIENNFINFKFGTINTSYIKISFIKEQPDAIDSNTYYVALEQIAVALASVSKKSTLISKSTEIKPFSTETPVIGTIAADVKGIIPDNCSAEVYVATDKIIPAYFIDAEGNYVRPESNNKVELVKADELTPTENYVLLSDIIGKTNISGVADFNYLNFDWKILNTFTNDNMKPKMINFINIDKKDPFNNTISSARKVLFGDSAYQSLISGTYPQDNYPGGLDPWFMSGVINESNPYWDPYMSGLVDQYPDLYDLDYEEPTGFPFNWYNDITDDTLRFNELLSTTLSTNDITAGWYRPYSDYVTPSGIVNVDGDKDSNFIEDIENPEPDFYINGIKFYKIYRFDDSSNVIASDISLYTYQTKPVIGNSDNLEQSGVYDYYPHNMIWVYNDTYTPNTKTVTTTTAPGSGYFGISIDEGTKYVPHSVRDVHYYNENIYLEQGRQYNVIDNTESIINSGFPSGLFIDMSPIADDDIYIPDGQISLNFSYNEINNYLSYWKGYIIVDDESVDLTIKQNDFNGQSVVNKYKIVNVETNEVITSNETAGLINYKVVSDDQDAIIKLNRGVYEFNVHCLTDIDGSLPANFWSPNSSNNMTVNGNAKIVADIKPLRVVSLETLLYATTYENDYRCAVITESDGLQYVVVKEPSKNIIPGYYFNNNSNSYIKESEHLIQNIGHYKRKYFDIELNEYITGSSGNIITSGDYFNDATYQQDIRWNNGRIYPQDFNNTNSGLYPVHSTFGNTINIDDDFVTTNNKGHLFYNTSENLPSFYTIKYGLVDTETESANRFLYRIDLISEHESFTPILDSVRFTMNTNIDELK